MYRVTINETMIINKDCFDTHGSPIDRPERLETVTQSSTMAECSPGLGNILISETDKQLIIATRTGRLRA